MGAPLLVVDPAGPLPPYEQIRTQVRRLIAAGRLAPGAPLPSVRQMARDLGVATNTVARAYAELAAEGWIESRPRRGAVVADRAEQLGGEERSRQLSQAVSELLDTAHQLGARSGELLAELRRQLEARRIGDSG
jgi:DNA-binding transcriptional regulator YhcF (GntR family)